MSELFKRFIRMVVALIPTKHNLWIFGAWRGRLYADNSKYLFEYINSNHSEIKAVWITRQPEIAEQVRKLGYTAYSRFSLLGLWSVARANVAFMTEGMHDISPFWNKKTKFFQLWHGMGMKAVGLKSGWVNRMGTGKHSVTSKETKAHADCIWLCASKEAITKYSYSFGVPQENFVITGEPKNDTFTNNSPSVYIKQLREEHPGAQIAVYLPTHRNFGTGRKSDILSPTELEKVNVALTRINAVLIFKPHYHEFAQYRDCQNQFSNIVFATDIEKFGDVYEFLPSCDMLITDYSGIMFGYLASGKPIIYFPHDKESYMTGDAGFYYNYEDVLYGPVCMTWEEVTAQIATITPEQYEAQRERQRERFCPYHDGKSCERVYQEVKKRTT